MNAMLDQDRYREALAAFAEREVAARREAGDLDHNWNHLRGTSGAKSYATGVFAGRKMTQRAKHVLALIASGVETRAEIKERLGLTGRDDAADTISTHMRSGYIEAIGNDGIRKHYRITDRGREAIAYYGAEVPPAKTPKPEPRPQQPGDSMVKSRDVLLAIAAGSETSGAIQKATEMTESQVSGRLRDLVEKGFINRHRNHGAKLSYSLTALGRAKAQEWRA